MLTQPHPCKSGPFSTLRSRLKGRMYTSCFLLRVVKLLDAGLSTPALPAPSPTLALTEELAMQDGTSRSLSGGRSRCSLSTVSTQCGLPSFLQLLGPDQVGFPATPDSQVLIPVLLSSARNSFFATENLRDARDVILEAMNFESGQLPNRLIPRLQMKCCPEAAGIAALSRNCLHAVLEEESQGASSNVGISTALEMTPGWKDTYSDAHSRGYLTNSPTLLH